MAVKKKAALALTKKSRKKLAISNLLLFVAGILTIYVSATDSSLGTLNRWLLALALLLIIGMAIKRVNGFVGDYGLYLLSTKKGLGLIDRISRVFKSFWIQMSMWGVVVGLGIFAYPLLKGRIDKRTYAFGLVSLVFILFFVIPYVGLSLQFINLPQLQSAIQNRPPAYAPTAISVIAYVFYALAVISGLGGYVVALLIYNAWSILFGIGQFAVSAAAGAPQTGTLVNQLPGAAPLIPGVDIPLVAGIISLVLLLVVHEFSHGVLARIDKIRLKSVGLVVFGIIPVGAFVEPDEKAIEKLPSEKQSRILAAGISSNFVLMVVFFALTFLTYVYLVPGLTSNNVLVQQTVPGLPANGILQPGMQILYWNGYRIENLSSFTVAAANDLPGSNIIVVTNTGSYSFKAVKVDNLTKGYIGIDVYEPIKTDFASQVIYFFFSVFSLSGLDPR